MATDTNKFIRTSGTLAADVADSGTFTISAYPTGSIQGSFLGGLSSPSLNYIVINGNDKWTKAAAKMDLTFNSTTITVTNNSGVTWAAGSTWDVMMEQADGNRVSDLAFHIDLVNITTTQDALTDFRPGIDGVIENICFVTDKPVTTAAKLATITAAINGTITTGGAVALTSALATPMGAVIQGSAITAANTITRDDKLSLKCTGVTAFAEGTGQIHVRIRHGVSNAY